MMHGKIGLPDIDGVIAEISALADKIDRIAIDVMDKTVDYMRDEMKKELEGKIKNKSLSTGAALAAIKSEHSKVKGDQIVAKVGGLYIRGKDKSGFHLVYLEYGSPTRAATPWMRPVLDRQDDINRFQKEQLRKRGVPVL